MLVIGRVVPKDRIGGLLRCTPVAGGGFAAVVGGRPPAELVAERVIIALTARLDQLSASARDTAQIAAALGREFRYELLAAVSPKTEWSLREDLNELAESDLVYARHAAAADAYIFKHSLVRDAAYDTMVRPARQRVHAQIAAVLQDRFTALTEQQPEILAQHLEAGGDLPRALVWWHRAGDRALRRAAYAEAAQQLEHALEVLQRLPPSNDRGQMEVQLLTTLGTVQFSTRGYSAPEVEQTQATLSRG